MVRPPKDIEWPTSLRMRRSIINYHPDGDILVIGRKKGIIRVRMGAATTAITSIIRQIEDLQRQRDMDLDVYGQGLFIYLTQLLGEVARFLEHRRGDAAVTALQDFSSREQHGFHHDSDGRSAWMLFMAEGIEAQNQSDDSTAAAEYVLFSSPPYQH
jgi:hypothetical protein